MAIPTPESQLTLTNSTSPATTATTTNKTTKKATLTITPPQINPCNPLIVNTSVQIKPHIPTISTSFAGPPSLGPILATGQRRALLGWTHRNDTPDGLMRGKLWCWVGKGGGGGFQVYDAPVNRSPFPVGTGTGPNAAGGLTIDCGVANFGMVRMFHPWWCPYSRAPKDMNSADKRMCRHRYRQLIGRHEQVVHRNTTRNHNRNRQRMEVDESDSDDELLFFNRRGGARNRHGRVWVREPRGRRTDGGYINVGNSTGTKKKSLIIELDDDTGVEGWSAIRRNGGEEMKAIENQGRYLEVGAGGVGGDNSGGNGAGADFEILIKETQKALRGGTADTAGSGRENDPFFIA